MPVRVARWKSVKLKGIYRRCSRARMWAYGPYKRLLSDRDNIPNVANVAAGGGKQRSSLRANRGERAESSNRARPRSSQGLTHLTE